MSITSFDAEIERPKILASAKILQNWLNWYEARALADRCETCRYWDGRQRHKMCKKGEFITQAENTCDQHKPWRV